jgi:hypothetical protein
MRGMQSGYSAAAVGEATKGGSDRNNSHHRFRTIFAVICHALGI